MFITDLKKHFRSDIEKHKIPFSDPLLNMNNAFDADEEKFKFVELYAKRFPRTVVDWFDQHFVRHGGRMSMTDLEERKVVRYQSDESLPNAKAYDTLNRYRA